MCNTAYNLKAVFVFFLNFGDPFAVTASIHSNMSLKSGGGALPPPLAYTLAVVLSYTPSQLLVLSETLERTWEMTLTPTFLLVSFCIPSKAETGGDSS